MPKRSRIQPKKDLNTRAFDILQQVSNEKSKEDPSKNPAAVALGRLGGLKGGKARAEKLSKNERRIIAINAAKVRWGKKGKKD